MSAVDGGDRRRRWAVEPVRLGQAAATASTAAPCSSARWMRSAGAGRWCWWAAGEVPAGVAVAVSEVAALGRPVRGDSGGGGCGGADAAAAGWGGRRRCATSLILPADLADPGCRRIARCSPPTGRAGDADGGPQWLLARAPLPALRAASPNCGVGRPTGSTARDLLGPPVRGRGAPVAGPVCADIDTPSDAARRRRAPCPPTRRSSHMEPSELDEWAAEAAAAVGAAPAG